MFKNHTEFSMHIEQIKLDNGFETYIDALMHFYEHESDHEFDDIVKLLNKKIISEIEVEASRLGLLKNSNLTVTLF